MARLLLFLILAALLLDVASIVWVGAIFGAGVCIALLVSGLAAGISIIRSAGANLAEALRLPIQSLSAQQGAASRTVLRMLAGLLFVMPGFVSDLVAVLMLLPPTEAWFARKVSVASNTCRVRAAAGFGTVIEGEATEISDDLRAAPHRSID